jgi:hypothetical protein
MESLATAILSRVATSLPQLRDMPESETARKPSPDRWSKKEILGHLIDSACNNHQRFVRAQLEGGLTFPGYEQEGWVRCQGYATADWSLLVDLWAAYNRHVAVVVARLPVASRSFTCRIAGCGQTACSIAGCDRGSAAPVKTGGFHPWKNVRRTFSTG